MTDTAPDSRPAVSSAGPTLAEEIDAVILRRMPPTGTPGGAAYATLVLATLGAVTARHAFGIAEGMTANGTPATVYDVLRVANDSTIVALAILEREQAGGLQ